MKDKEDQSESEVNLQCIDAIEVSLFIEREGLRFYEKAARVVKHPKVREIFRSLAREEKEHIQSLKTKAEFLKPALLKKARARHDVEEFIARELKGKVFPDADDPEAGLAGVKTDLEALELGIRSEQRSIDMLSQLMQDERKIDVRAVFSHLLAEEKRHLAALLEIKKSCLSSTGP